MPPSPIASTRVHAPSASPAIAPTGAAHGPAQITTSGDMMLRIAVSTPATWPARLINATTGSFSTITAPRRRAALAYPGRHLHRAGQAVAGAEGGAAEIVPAQPGDHAGRLPRRELDHILEPEPALQPGGFRKPRPLLLRRQQEEVPNRSEVRRRVDLAFEVGQHALGLHPDPDVDLGGELRPHAAGTGRGRPLADRAALHHDHAPPRAGEVKRQAAPHDAGAHDHDLGVIGARRAA